MRVASLCRYWQKRKTGRQKQSSHDFARPWFHMSRQCAEEDLFHSCFPLYFGFPFRVMFVVRHLFPEIQDEVPENFLKGLNFLPRIKRTGGIEGARFAWPSAVFGPRWVY